MPIRAFNHSRAAQKMEKLHTPTNSPRSFRRAVIRSLSRFYNGVVSRKKLTNHNRSFVSRSTVIGQFPTVYDLRLYCRTGLNARNYRHDSHIVRQLSFITYAHCTSVIFDSVRCVRDTLTILSA